MPITYLPGYPLSGSSPAIAGSGFFPGGVFNAIFQLSTVSVTTQSLTSNVVTLTTSAAHSFTVGNKVIVSGQGSPYDGTYVITSVTDTGALVFLTDSFATQDAAKWTYAGTAGVASGVLTFTPNSGSIGSVLNYNVVNNTTAVQVLSKATGGGGSQFDLSMYSAGNTLIWRIYVPASGPTVAYAFSPPDYTTHAIAGFVWGTHSWIRIRIASGVVYWEYSANNVTWTTGFSASLGTFDASKVTISMSINGAGTTGNWTADNFTSTNLGSAALTYAKTNANVAAAGAASTAVASSLSSAPSTIFGTIKKMWFVAVTATSDTDFQVVDVLALSPSFGAIYRRDVNFGSPAVRDSVQVLPNSDGTIDDTQYLEARAISISGVILDKPFTAAQIATYDSSVDWNSAAYWTSVLGAWAAPNRRWLLVWLSDSRLKFMFVRGAGIDVSRGMTDRYNLPFNLSLVNYKGKTYSLDPTTSDGFYASSTIALNDTAAYMTYGGTVPTGFIAKISTGGAALVNPRLTFTYPSYSPVFANAASTTASIGLVGTFPANAVITINTIERTLTQTLAGVVTSLNQYIAAPFTWPVLNPTSIGVVTVYGTILSDTLTTKDTTKWTDTGYPYTVSSGTAHFGTAGSTNSSIMQSIVSHSLTETSIVFQIPSAPSGGSTPSQIILRILPLSGDVYRILYLTKNVSGTIDLNAGWVNNVTSAQSFSGVSSFNLAANSYLRLRNTGGSLYWEYSPDGTTYTTFRTESAVVEAAAVLQFSGYDGTGATGDWTVDNVSWTTLTGTLVPSTQPGYNGVVLSGTGGDAATNVVIKYREATI